MGSVHDLRSAPQDVMLDIDAELRHWRGCYRESAFHRSAREFDDYIPTLKFGYDAYLLHYRTDLDELVVRLKPRYERSIPEWQRLEWPLTEAIIRETWKRMKSGQPWRSFPHRQSRTMERTAAAM